MHEDPETFASTALKHRVNCHSPLYWLLNRDPYNGMI